MENGWFPPPRRAIKINIHGTTVEAPLANGNTNGIGVLARNYYGDFLWGFMGPLKGIEEELRVHLWAIHIAMKHAFQLKIPDVILETNNLRAFEIIEGLDDEEIEFEDVVEVMQQINKLSTAYNKRKIDGSPGWSCELKIVIGTRNSAASHMAYHGMVTCERLTEVSTPFERLQEIIDMDIGLGPHLDAFVIRNNSGWGEIVNGEAPPSRNVFPRGVNAWFRERGGEMVRKSEPMQPTGLRWIAGVSNQTKRTRVQGTDQLYPPGFEAYAASIDKK